jgi:Ca-activated chloride channel family protein
MTLDAPLLLAVGLLVTAGLGGAGALLTRRRAAALTAIGAADRKARAGQLGVWLTVAGIGLLSIAAAGPAASVPVPRAAGTVILAMDVSGSMGADDASPTRLGAAQNTARAFIQAQPESVDIGVVAFENGALVTAAPSGDHQAAIAAVNRLTVTGGTSLAAAILGALSAITGQTVFLDDDGSAPDIGYWPSATIVMLTDGEDQTGGQADDDPARISAAAGAAQQAGVSIHTLGVGTPQGAVVTVDEVRLHTALDAETLAAIAQTTGGSYQLASEAAALGQVSGTIEQRLTVADQIVPLAGGFILVALALLAAGATVTILRAGRVI